MSQVSVFVPCYRYAHFLRACVESILAQPGVDVRVLILDDASPDNTAEVAAELVSQDPRVEYRRHTTNRGHIATYNEGLEWASGDYTVLLSADDMLTPGALARATRLLDAHFEVGFVYGRALTFQTNQPLPRPSTLSAECHWQIQPGLEWLEAMWKAGYNHIICPEVVVRTSLQHKIGGYRADLPHLADMEMWMRFAAHAAVGVLDADQAFYRIHSQNMHSQQHSTLLDLQERKRVFTTVFQDYGASIPNREQLDNLINRRLARHALLTVCEAFDRGETVHTPIEGLIDFAIRTYPDVPLMREYSVGLRWRQRLGPQLCPLLRSVRDVALPRWLGRQVGAWLYPANAA